jgi:hypothetical protein
MTIIEPAFSRSFRLINTVHDLPDGLYLKDHVVRLFASEGHVKVCKFAYRA